MRRILLAPLLLCASLAGAQTTLLTDTMTGTLGTNLTAHTPNNGGSWTQVGSCDTFQLDGNGYVYATSGGAAHNGAYQYSGSYTVNNTLTYTADITALSDATGSAPGIWVTDNAGHGYSLASYSTGISGFAAGFGLERDNFGACAPTLTGLAHSSTFTPSGVYNLSLTIVTDGTTVTMSGTVKQSGSTLWSFGPVYDTVYPNLTKVGVKEYVLTGGITSTTGHHIGNLSATYQLIPKIVPSPVSVNAGSAGNVITLTGFGTAWTAGVTTFAVSAGTITSQSCSSATAGSITLTAPAGASVAITITDSADALSAQIITNTPVTDAGFYFSPGNWYLNGSTYAISPSAGAYLYLKWNGTDAFLNIDTSTLGANPLYVRVSVDGAAYTDTNVQAASTIALASHLTNAAHTATVYYRARNVNIDSWTTPTDGLKILSATLNPGASTSAPTVRPNTCLVLSDSRGEGFNDLTTGGAAAGQDATTSATFGVQQTLNCEVGIAAYAGIGWTTTGQTNVPAMPSSWNLIFSGHARTVNTFNYIVVEDMGTNDNRGSVTPATVQTAVTNWLTAARAAAPSAKIIVNPAWDGGYANYVQIGFNNYQTATPDQNAFFVLSGLTTAQSSLYYCQVSGGTSSFYTTDCLHPSILGQQVVSQGLYYNLDRAINMPPVVMVNSF